GTSRGTAESRPPRCPASRMGRGKEEWIVVLVESPRGDLSPTVRGPVLMSPSCTTRDAAHGGGPSGGAPVRTRLGLRRSLVFPLASRGPLYIDGSTAKLHPQNHLIWPYVPKHVEPTELTLRI